ncbi:MAG: HAMP domain-containing sensor histidine kinase [Flavobacterium sp.]|nr:HAMP domain-containing sensor histidine kinase [Flavobacterium sp.]
MASKALDLYKNKRLLPVLPTDFDDEAGLLMANIVSSIKNSENLLKQKQDLVYLLSHDLRNFAATPASLAQVILDENPVDAIKKSAELILLSTSRQTEFIESIINLMQEEEKILSQHLRVKSISFTDIIAAVNQDLGQKLQSKNLQLIVATDLKEAHLKITQEMLTQVVINLIDNAIKFSHPGKEICITIQKTHAHIEIEVKDSGIGFDNGERNELFQKFTKMRRVGTQNESTIGIGLYLCNQIIKKSDGTIKAESRGENKGATFSVRLKIYRRSNS